MNNSEKSNDNHPGLICPTPGCGFKIKFTMQDLVTKEKVVCPSCNLTLDMTIPTEMKKHLEEIRLTEGVIKNSDKGSQ
ncbi:MAG: hypothetical protein JNM21_16285 [Taibaiella sp.]|nr:hypothetical protein [Taibaiella sp.]